MENMTQLHITAIEEYIVVLSAIKDIDINSYKLNNFLGDNTSILTDGNPEIMIEIFEAYKVATNVEMKTMNRKKLNNKEKKILQILIVQYWKHYVKKNPEFKFDFIENPKSMIKHSFLTSVILDINSL